MSDVEESSTAIESALTPLTARGALLPTAIFARAAAHGLRNRLNPLGLQLALLRRRTSDEATRELIESLNASLRELDQMLERVQRFGQRVAPPPRDDDELTQALERVERGLRTESREATTD